MKTLKNIFILPVICMALILSCAEDEIGPVLGESETFVAPVLKSPSTTPSYVIIPEIAGELFEEFIWDRTQYNLNLSSTYVLEMDDSENFDNPRSLGTTSANSMAVSNRRFNDVMLSLGLPGFEESTVFVRVRSTITGMASSDTLYSNVVTRNVTTFQSSECGNFCTIGLIGSATQGGWDTDTDMRLADPEKVDKSTWTTTIYLIGGEKVKFRADDDWGNNWGGTSFPAGTGSPGGDDITVSTTGYYKVTFNDESGAYNFEIVTGKNFSSIGLVGDATPGGWGSDTFLSQDADNPHIWTGTVTLTEAVLKFRADADWADNWGGTSFPSGFGVGGGADIAAKAGTYFVHFNSITGEYAFMKEDLAEPFSSLGIIGSATSGGWDDDTDMIQNPNNPYLWSKIVTLTEGEAKFRADDKWDVSWGGSDFPGGVGVTTPGSPNVPVREGTYFVTLHTGTGEYYFLK